MKRIGGRAASWHRSGGRLTGRSWLAGGAGGKRHCRCRSCHRASGQLNDRSGSSRTDNTLVCDGARRCSQYSHDGRSTQCHCRSCWQILHIVHVGRLSKWSLKKTIKLIRVLVTLGGVEYGMSHAEAMIANNRSMDATIALSFHTGHGNLLNCRTKVSMMVTHPF